MSELIAYIKSAFYVNFIKDNRWKHITEGLGNTLKITFFACILGIVIGALLAVIRSTYDAASGMKKKTPGYYIMTCLNWIAKTYITVIRGTPVVVQLMIMYYVIMVNTDNGVFVAILSFGINSGAYVAEVIRSGIMSIDKGQTEAGRSLGFNYVQTMWYIILPQAIKNVLPSLANEFIALLKETSVSGYITVKDLTRAGDIIRGRTFSPLFPLLAVALIYLVLVLLFSSMVSKLERRLRSSDH